MVFDVTLIETQNGMQMYGIECIHTHGAEWNAYVDAYTYGIECINNDRHTYMYSMYMVFYMLASSLLCWDCRFYVGIHGRCLLTTAV